MDFELQFFFYLFLTCHYAQGSDSLRIADSEADPSESVRSVSPGLYRTSSPVSSITDLSSWPGGSGSQRLADLPDDRGSWSQRVPESEAGSSWAGGSQRLTEDSLEAGSWSQRIPEETEAMETEAELEVSVISQSESCIYPVD